MDQGFNFANKTILVTGGSSGIGRATAILFARHGAKVVIGDIDLAGERTVEAIEGEKGEAIFVRTDVRDRAPVQNLVATAVKTYGGLHCAFNNAGVLPPMSMLADSEESTFDQTFAVDVKGVFLAMKYEIQQMLKTGGGVIVNNASIAGLIAERGISTYVAANRPEDGRGLASSRDRVRQSGNSDQRDCTGIGGNAYDQALVRRSGNAQLLPGELTDWSFRTTGGDREYGAISLFRPRVLRSRPNFRRRWRLHRALK